MCVECFNLADHADHEFYISRSDYGCCDCGDPFAWRPQGFCTRHPGPSDSFDPKTLLLPLSFRNRLKGLVEATVKRIGQIGIWEGLYSPAEAAHEWPDSDRPIPELKILRGS